jgi:hypothetical protein
MSTHVRYLSSNPKWHPVKKQNQAPIPPTCVGVCYGKVRDSATTIARNLGVDISTVRRKVENWTSGEEGISQQKDLLHTYLLSLYNLYFAAEAYAL